MAKAMVRQFVALIVLGIVLLVGGVYYTFLRPAVPFVDARSMTTYA
jgi:hypothetical protein